jgi:hydrogenase small subunit
MPGFGIEATADKVGKIGVGVVAAGVAAHAVGSVITRHKSVQSQINRGIKNDKDVQG